MAKLETKNINIDIPIIEAKNNLIKNIEMSDEFSLQNLLFDNNEYTILIEAKKSYKSNKGEDIEVKIKDIDERYSFISIKSELKAKLQKYDWNKNDKNIDRMLSFIRSSYKHENSYDTKNLVIEKYKSQLESVQCIYYGGHENVTNEAKGTLNVYPDRIEFVIIRKQFEIPISSIINNEIMHQEQITQRITATRMIAFGFFSLATPKKKNNISNYLTIEYEEKGVRSMLILKGASSFTISANDSTIKLNSAIIKARRNYMSNESNL